MNNNIFESTIEFPDPLHKRLFASLIGLDHIKERLIKEASLMLNPHLLNEWAEKYHSPDLQALEVVQSRVPLFVFAGDVGSGKTALAESFGNEISSQHKLPIFLYRLSLTARGNGAVGQMTTLITNAFEEVRKFARDGMHNGTPSYGVILVIDEADSLAQSRESVQMHHEDRAGVNALIRGLDGLKEERLPIVTVLCTNRPNAIDPAVRRRAAEVFQFSRPNIDLIYSILEHNLNINTFTKTKLKELAKILFDSGEDNIGVTCSDITQRYLPSLVLQAYPSSEISIETALQMAKTFQPTPPFKDN